MDVVFDLGKVLVDWDPRYLFVDHLGMEPAKAEVFLSEVCSPQWHLEFDRGRTFSEGIALLRRSHPQHIELIETYAQEWPRMFAGAIEHSREQLLAMHENGIRLHALTNYPPQKIRFLYETYDFMQHFHTVVVSGLLKVIKPDPAIYRHLLTSIGAQSCIFIDDRLENVVAAQEAGIEALHFTPEEGQARLAALRSRLCVD